MLYTAAIDLGTGFTKAVILRGGGQPIPPVRSAGQAGLPDLQVVGKGRVKTGVDLEAAASRALTAALAEAGLSAHDIAYTATTGFGRYGFSARDIQITDITAAARGAFVLVPQSPVVLDIGNQCTRAIAITPDGKVKTFKTNDKCAAGSGSFIGRAAKYLQVPLEDVGDIALKAIHPQPISSVCAVLAESEIINLVSAGTSIEDILRGIYDSLAERAATLLRRVGLGKEITFVGGVAKQAGMVQALEERIGVKVHVPHDCDFVCAIGAAVLGERRHFAAGQPPRLPDSRVLTADGASFPHTHP